MVLFPQALNTTTISHRTRPEPMMGISQKKVKTNKQKILKMVFRLESVHFTTLIFLQFLLQRQREQNPYYLE